MILPLLTSLEVHFQFHFSSFPHFEDFFTITRSLISELMVAYHSLLGKSRHVKTCDRRQMFALPLSRRVSASKGCLCAAQIYWHQVTKNRKQQKTRPVPAFLCVCLALAHTYKHGTINNSIILLNQIAAFI